jgi:hypothetical protein
MQNILWLCFLLIGSTFLANISAKEIDIIHYYQQSLSFGGAVYMLVIDCKYNIVIKIGGVYELYTMV